MLEQNQITRWRDAEDEKFLADDSMGGDGGCQVLVQGPNRELRRVTLRELAEAIQYEAGPDHGVMRRTRTPGSPAVELYKGGIVTSDPMTIPAATNSITTQWLTQRGLITGTQITGLAVSLVAPGFDPQELPLLNAELLVNGRQVPQLVNVPLSLLVAPPTDQQVFFDTTGLFLPYDSSIALRVSRADGDPLPEGSLFAVVRSASDSVRYY